MAFHSVSERKARSAQSMSRSQPDREQRKASMTPRERPISAPAPTPVERERTGDDADEKDEGGDSETYPENGRHAAGDNIGTRGRVVIFASAN